MASLNLQRVTLAFSLTEPTLFTHPHAHTLITDGHWIVHTREVNYLLPSSPLDSFCCSHMHTHTGSTYTLSTHYKSFWKSAQFKHIWHKSSFTLRTAFLLLYIQSCMFSTPVYLLHPDFHTLGLFAASHMDTGTHCLNTTLTQIHTLPAMAPCTHWWRVYTSCTLTLYLVSTPDAFPCLTNISSAQSTPCLHTNHTHSHAARAHTASLLVTPDCYLSTSHVYRQLPCHAACRLLIHHVHALQAHTLSREYPWLLSTTLPFQWERCSLKAITRCEMLKSTWNQLFPQPPQIILPLENTASKLLSVGRFQVQQALNLLVLLGLWQNHAD